MVQLAGDSASEDKLMFGLGYRREMLRPGVNVFYYVGNYRTLVKRLACVPLRTAPRVPSPPLSSSLSTDYRAGRQSQD